MPPTPTHCPIGLAGRLPHRGNANRPLRKRDPARAKIKPNPQAFRIASITNCVAGLIRLFFLRINP